MTNKIDSKIIDEAIFAALAEAKDGQITADDILHRLKHDDEATRERIERELDSDDSLFKDFENNSYILQRAFFNSKVFNLTPDELEIENNLLFPGHRFSAFCDSEIFPSEVKLIDESTKQAQDIFKFSCDVTETIPFHILMGSEQIFDFFVAEDSSNSALLNRVAPVRKVTLNVFNMKDFYRRHEFRSGDALQVTIKDWDKGVFSFKYLSGAERKNKNIESWVNDFADALEKVIDRFDNYLEIPDQLRWAFFFGGKSLFGNQGASLDEFYRKTDRIEINFENAGHTVLGRTLTPSESESVALPDEVMVSKGKVSSIDEILADIGSPLKATEIDAYILDQCYRGELEFDRFFSRCFNHEKLTFSDDAQEAIFVNYIEDRWELISEKYSRLQDEPKAEFRERILEIIDTRVSWLEYLQDMELNIKDLPEKEIKQMAESSLYLTELLELINSEENTLQPDEAENILDAIANVAEIQEEMIENINLYLKQ
ncbi:MAG: hypothetical protein WC071_09255 [Victivallaceae bacterium]